jgi:ABC-type dipeptide/oligopeptide/nickel transport system permease subunit
MVSQGKSYLQYAPGYSLFPGVAIVILILSLDVIADRIRRRFAGDENSVADAPTKAA